MKSAWVFQDELSGCLPGNVQGTGWSGWGRTQHWDMVSCGWGMEADPGVQAQILSALAEAEEQQVALFLSGGMVAVFEDKYGKDKRSEVGRMVPEEAYGSEEE